MSNVRKIKRGYSVLGKVLLGKMSPHSMGEGAGKMKGKSMRNCPGCKKDFMGKGNQVYCDISCYKETHKKRNTHGRQYNLSTATVGALGELRVAVDLMRNGYNVYRALSPSAPCDLLIFKDEKLIEVEVRTAVVTRNGRYYYSKMTPRSEIIFAVVLPDKIIYHEKNGQVIVL